MNVLQELLEMRKLYEQEVQENTALLKTMEEELKNLNQPIGPAVDDAARQLQSYQDVLKKLQKMKETLESLRNSSSATVTDLESIVSRLHDFLQQVQAQVAKLKQMVALREQFQTLIAEIMRSLAKYTEAATAIESLEPMPAVTTRIDKYQDLLTNLVGCEANLLAATDKGRKIAEEGTASDRNAITEQLQNLKEQLTNLKRLVEAKKAEHEVIAEELNRIISELYDKIDWLQSNEAQFKTRPLLHVDAESPKAELQKCVVRPCMKCDKYISVLNK